MGRGFESRASYLELAQGEGLQPGRWEGKRKEGLLRRRMCFRKSDAERWRERGRGVTALPVEPRGSWWEWLSAGGR